MSPNDSETAGRFERALVAVSFLVTSRPRLPGLQAPAARELAHVLTTAGQRVRAGTLARELLNVVRALDAEADGP